MGRFYRTANGNPLDYMYRSNIPLMEKVIGVNDQYIGEELNQGTQLSTAASTFPYLQADEQRAKEITDQYSKQIDDVTSAIKSDPANWRSKQSDIQNLSRNLQDNYRVGEISKISGNYSTLKSKFDEIDASAKEYQKSGKGIRPEDADRFKQDMLKKFIDKSNGKGTGYDPKTGKYNTIDVYSPADYMDIHKVVDDEVSKIVKDKNTTEFSQFLGNSANGAQPYFDDEKQVWSGIPKDKILSVAMSRLQNPEIQNYLSQYSDVGIISGYKDKNGSVISPFNKSLDIIPTKDEEDQKDKMQTQINQLRRSGNIDQADEIQKKLNGLVDGIKNRTKINWDNQSVLTPILQGAIDKYSGAETERSSKLRTNSIYSSNNQIAAANWRTTYTQGKLDDRQQTQIKATKEIADAKNAADENKVRLTAALKANGGKGAANIDTKTTTTPDVLAEGYQTPYSIIGKDPKQAITNLDLASKANAQEIQNLYARRDKAIADKDNNTLDLVNSQIEQVKTKQSLLGNKAQVALDDAKKAVFSSPEDEGIFYFREQAKKDYNALVNEFGNNRNGDLVLRTIEEGNNLNIVDADNHPINISKEEQARMKKVITKYKKSVSLESRVNAKYAENLTRAANEKTNGRVIVETSINSDNDIRKAWDADLEAFHVIDPATGQSQVLDMKQFDPYSKDIKIIGAGPAGGEDGNNDMTIHIRYQGKDFDVVPTGRTGNELKSKILDNWSKNGTDKAKVIANSMSNPYYQDINSALNQPITKKNEGVGTVAEDIPVIIQTPQGNQKIIIAPISKGDAWNSPAYRLKMETGTGYETIKDFSSGWDIANYLKTIFPEKK